MRIITMLAALFCGALLAAPAQAQTAYPLQCRAGGGMLVNVLGTAGGGTEVVILFNKATVTHAIPAGSCAWFDRPLNAAEPRSLKLTLSVRMSVDVTPHAGDHTGDHADLFVYPGSGADAPLATSLISTLKSGGTFTVRAYNGGHGLLLATRFAVAAPR